MAALGSPRSSMGDNLGTSIGEVSGSSIGGKSGGSMGAYARGLHSMGWGYSGVMS